MNLDPTGVPSAAIHGLSKDLIQQPAYEQGKSLFMPLRVLLTGKLHGPDMGGSILMIYKAGILGVVNPELGFITLDDRVKTLREVDWEALEKDNKPIESVAGVFD
ncbi:hypothetical protein Cni_G00647 [Canna indica]|uniref:Uncharacterized protein n=1 Tax=Canna indica TaxID=4628 RepID=A0AAQ3JL55_9LILI|nr:hypothetical protein Cni_G00647 [Canna indica]